MNEHHDTIEETLSRMKVRDLSETERGAVWQHIEAKHARPYHSLLAIIKKPMIVPLIVILGLVAGTGGAAAAADNAKPGDKLFGLDQAIERLELKFAGENTKNELRIRFAEERLEEIKELLAEKEEDEKKEDDKKDEDGDDEAKAELSAEQEARVALGLEAALNLINKVEDEDNERLASLTERLNGYLDELPSEAEVKVNDNKIKIETEDGQIQIKERKDGDTRIESRTEDGRVRVEIKDGVVEVKVKDSGDSEDDEGEDEDEDEEDDDRSGSNSGRN